MKYFQKLIFAPLWILVILFFATDARTAEVIAKVVVVEDTDSKKFSRLMTAIEQAFYLQHRLDPVTAAQENPLHIALLLGNAMRQQQQTVQRFSDKKARYNILVLEGQQFCLKLLKTVGYPIIGKQKLTNELMLQFYQAGIDGKLTEWIGQSFNNEIGQALPQVLNAGPNVAGYYDPRWMSGVEEEEHSLLIRFTDSDSSQAKEEIKLIFGDGTSKAMQIEKSHKYSQPNPMGMGTQDPRNPKKDSQSDETIKNVNIQLFYAVGDDDVKYAKSLILQGAEPNANVPGSDMKILMAAQSAAMVKMLIENGADPNQTDSKGATALHYLVSAPSALEIVPILIRSGANVNAATEGRGNRTALHEASIWYFEERDHSVGELLIRLLVSSGADINAPEYLGKTLLHKAVENDKADLLKLLLDLGADPNIKDGGGSTPLESAKSLNLKNIIRIFNKGS